METENAAESPQNPEIIEAHTPATEDTVNENTDEEIADPDPVIKEIKKKPQTSKDPKIKEQISQAKQNALAKARLGKAQRAKSRKEMLDKMILEIDSDDNEYIITRRKIQKPAEKCDDSADQPAVPRKQKRPATPSPEPERSPSPPLRPKLRFV